MANFKQASVEPRTWAAACHQDTPLTTGCKTLQPLEWVPPKGGDATPLTGENAPQHRYIRADHVLLAMVASKARPSTRWAAMSNGAHTSQCTRRQPGGGFYMHSPPVLQPLTAGRMQHLYERVRSHGRSEVLRTWRTSISVLKAEFASCVLRRSAGG